MAGTPFIDGPTLLTATYTANHYFPGALTYAVIGHIHLSNSDSSARTVRLYVTTTGDATLGKHIAYDLPVAIGGVADLYFPAGLQVSSASSLGITGGASATNVVSMTIMGELYVI